MVQALFKYELVDELRLLTFPIILGVGKRLFSYEAIPAAFQLIDHLASSNGIVFTHYQRAGEVKTGTIGE